MLEQYYIRPVTVDRIRTSWIAPAIEKYVSWLTEQQYTRSSVSRRIPLLVAFGEFAKNHGATEVVQLPDYVEPFVLARVAMHGRRKSAARARQKIVECARNPVRQMLRLALPDYIGLGRPTSPAIRLSCKPPGSLRISPRRRGFARAR